jgi:hypothetical protein
MTALERVRRSRQLRRNGAVLVTVLLDAEGVADLVDLGWLQAGASPPQVRAALVEMMATALDLRITPAAGMLRATDGGT